MLITEFESRFLKKNDERIYTDRLYFIFCRVLVPLILVDYTSEIDPVSGEF